MFNRTERAIAAVVLAACAAAVVVSIWPQPTEPPAKIWFAAQGGDLIFDHAFHATMVECRDCHHNSPAAEEQGRRVEMNCRACHYYDPAVKVTTADPHPRAIGASCTDCHDHLGAELSRCDACHLHLGYAFIASARYKQPFPQFVVFPEDDPVAVDSPGTVVFAHAYHSTIGQCLRCHHDYDPAATGVRPGEKNCLRCHHDASVVPAEGEMPHALFVGDCFEFIDLRRVVLDGGPARTVECLCVDLTIIRASPGARRDLVIDYTSCERGRIFIRTVRFAMPI